MPETQTKHLVSTRISEFEVMDRYYDDDGKLVEQRKRISPSPIGGGGRIQRRFRSASPIGLGGDVGG